MFDLDMADVKPGILNLLVVTLMAVVGINFGKFLFARFNVPGLKELFGAV